SPPTLVLRLSHGRGFHDDVLVIFHEKLRFLLWLSVTRPRRAVALCGGHSFKRQSWKKFTAARSTPTVPSFCIQVNGRQLPDALPVKRCTSEFCVTCMMSPGDHWSASYKGVP